MEQQQDIQADPHPATDPASAAGGSPVAVPTARPSMLKVLGLLVAAALVLSWLFSYAIMGALVSAEFVRPFTGRTDTRPVLFGGVFVGLMAVSGTAVVLLRRASGREIAGIDEMLVTEDDGKGDDLLRITGPGAKTPSKQKAA